MPHSGAKTRESNCANLVASEQKVNVLCTTIGGWTKSQIWPIAAADTMTVARDRDVFGWGYVKGLGLLVGSAIGKLYIRDFFPVPYFNYQWRIHPL
jgi:hypothetical protein